MIFFCSVFVWKISLLFFREVPVSLVTKRWWTWWRHAKYWTINLRLSWRLQRGVWPSGEKCCRPNCLSTLLWLVFPTRTMTIQRYWQHTLIAKVPYYTNPQILIFHPRHKRRLSSFLGNSFTDQRHIVEYIVHNMRPFSMYCLIYCYKWASFLFWLSSHS